MHDERDDKNTGDESEARARAIILERRRRFMAAAMAGLGVGAQGCDSTQQATPGDDGTKVATQNPNEPSVCLMFQPDAPTACLSPVLPNTQPPAPSVCLGAVPVEPSVCLQPPIDPPEPTVCLSPPIEPSVCLSAPYPDDAGVWDEDDAGA